MRRQVWRGRAALGVVSDHRPGAGGVRRRRFDRPILRALRLHLPPEIILAAGNIASCGSPNDEATASLLDTLPGTIFALGDNAFPDGSAQAYANCYAPSWGRHLARTYAVLG